ncbi:hypothetical protein [Phyllobacterium salinisoli]|uniref:hypothetical protein n=1 Tax=Phyllobacterium salinisoli TaxID=1899321 RepID=UPI00315D934B
MERAEVDALCSLIVGDFLEGLDLNRSRQLDHWIATQRRRYRSFHATLLQRMVELLPNDPRDLRLHAERWVELSPFDMRAQVLLLKSLIDSGMPDQAEHHFAAVARLFEAEGIDLGEIRLAWRKLRKEASAMSSVSACPAQPVMSADEDRMTLTDRASLAVMPFSQVGVHNGRLTRGLTHDIITRLAKLLNLFIIASGSVFALADQGVTPEDAARRLNVDYYASGVLLHVERRSQVSVELVETRTARIVWSGEFESEQDEAFLITDEIGDRIVASIASEIEMAERNRAILRPPSSLSAWEAYHRGLWHMYRFTKTDNDLAQQFFKQASETDPTFARAYSGLSFTHWQNAFQQWEDRERETALAFDAAGRSLMVDDQDPAAHWAMGRALWLRSRPEQAVAELERAVISARISRSALRLVLWPVAVGGPICGHRRIRPFAEPQSVRSAAVWNARRTRHGTCATGAIRGSSGLGSPRPPLAPTRISSFWPSRHTVWRWSDGSTRAKCLQR